MQASPDSTRPEYSRTQQAPLCLLIYALAAVFLALGYFTKDALPIRWLFPPIGLLMLVLAASIHHLTVEDRGDVWRSASAPYRCFVGRFGTPTSGPSRSAGRCSWTPGAFT